VHLPEEPEAEAGSEAGNGESAGGPKAKATAEGAASGTSDS
jgi:hypothetical protein